MKALTNRNGFSLVEVMLVLAISSIIGVAVMQTVRDSSNAMAASEAKFEELELARQVQTNLVYRPSCENTLKGKSLDNLTIADVEKLMDSENRPVLQKGAKVGNNSLQIIDFSFNISEDARTKFEAFKSASPAAGSMFMMDATFTLITEKLKSTVGGKGFKPREIPIKIKVDASNTIQECFAATEASDINVLGTFCTQMGGTFNSSLARCEFNTDCAKLASADMIPAKCVDEKIQAAVDSMNETLIALAKDRAPATVVSTATPPPTTIDPYTIPFSMLNPGKGCKGTGCAASDYGPCDGIACTTNGGSCKGSSCRTGVVTGVVKYDGKNIFTPANPGPGCTGTGCHANDYGPCNGIACTTNGGSCEGSSCRTGIIN